MAIWSFCISSGKSIGSIMAVVTEYGNGIWEWEICRQGEPLPARMRDGPFKSQEIALAAGRIALVMNRSTSRLTPTSNLPCLP
jgi:hypothetical protein